MSERLAREVRNLRLEHDAIVVGSGPLDGLVRDARDLDLLVQPDTFRALRELHGWQPAIAPDGTPLITNGATEVGTHWGGRTVGDLLPGSYQEHGVHFAGLPDVYRWKQMQAREKDLRDLSAITQRLLDRPLPTVMLHRELGFVQECTPADLPDHPALAVAANGLYIVRTLYGNHMADVHGYNGTFERHDVPALYHEYWHSAGGVERIARHMAHANARRRAIGRKALFSATDAYAAIAAFAYHDARLGDGRQSSNPTGFDELISAQLVARHLEYAGCTQESMPQKSALGIRATAFNEATKGQDIDPARGYAHIQEAVANTDLGAFAEPTFVCDTMRLAAEDLCRVGSGKERALGAFAARHQMRITTIADALELIDSDKALLQAFAELLAHSATFCHNYQPAETWTLENIPLRHKNAAFVARIAEGMLQGELTAAQAYQQAQQHAHAMQAWVKR